METPFINDPFAMVYKAFRNLYPDRKCQCQWVQQIPDGQGGLGRTTFAPDGRILVEVAGTLTVEDAIEVLAHELAHVAAGLGAHHGEAFENAFAAIYEEYNKLEPEEYD